MVKSEQLLFVALISIAWLLIIFFIYAIFIISAHGIQVDPDGYCSIKQFPYIQWCEQQKMQDLFGEFIRNYTR